MKLTPISPLIGLAVGMAVISCAYRAYRLTGETVSYWWIAVVISAVVATTLVCMVIDESKGKGGKMSQISAQGPLVSGATYDPTTRILTLLFRDGNSAAYRDVDEDEALDFIGTRRSA